MLKESVFDADQFLDALERVAGGGTAMDPAVIAKLLSSGSSNRRLERLTEREHSVLGLMAEGLSDQAVSRRLFLSESSIGTNTTSMFGKLVPPHRPGPSDDPRKIGQPQVSGSR